MPAEAPAMRTAAAELKHAERVQILVVANERDVSPARYVEEVFGFSPVEEPVAYKKALSHVSYHFRALEKAGCIAVVDLIPRRGAFEHVYRGTSRVQFPEEEWAKLTAREKEQLTRVTWQSLIARFEAARMALTLDARDDRWVTWTSARLDERGWSEMIAIVESNFAEMERVREESEARLDESDDAVIPTTFSMMCFESPKARVDPKK